MVMYPKVTWMRICGTVDERLYQTPTVMIIANKLQLHLDTFNAIANSYSDAQYQPKI